MIADVLHVLVSRKAVDFTAKVVGVWVMSFVATSGGLWARRVHDRMTRHDGIIVTWKKR